jgi:lipopolysaccharide transport system permease protein
LEILPIISLGSALFHTAISLLAWLLFYIVLFGLPPITTLYLPLILLPFILLTLGLSWLLASISVYLRDIGQIISIVTTALLFLSPIFYPLSTLPPAYQGLLQINPLTLPVEMARNAMFWGAPPQWDALLAYSAAALLTAWCGFAWFQKTRKGFADVL